MTLDKEFESALSETIPPIGEVERMRWWFEKGASAEREACAKICENASSDGYGYLPSVADTIRERSNA